MHTLRRIVGAVSNTCALILIVLLEAALVLAFFQAFAGCAWRSPQITVNVGISTNVPPHTNGVVIIQIHDNLFDYEGSTVSPKASFK